jgi:DNA-directed RNA polymerase specialized sigma subunit
MVRSRKDSGEEKQSTCSTLTDAQFDELKKLLHNYLKLIAMAAIKDMSEETLERNARMLDIAGFNQKEIGKILNVSQPTVARVLAGKWRKRREQK